MGKLLLIMNKKGSIFLNLTILSYWILVTLVVVIMFFIDYDYGLILYSFAIPIFIPYAIYSINKPETKSLKNLKIYTCCIFLPFILFAFKEYSKHQSSLKDSILSVIIYLIISIFSLLILEFLLYKKRKSEQFNL